MPRRPLDVLPPVVVGDVEGCPDPQVRPPEYAGLRMPEEAFEGAAGVLVGEGVRRREVLRQTAA